MKEKVFQTDNSTTALILRIMLGVVVFPHGAQKLFGWFGGYGFTGTMNYFTETVGLLGVIGFLVIILESIGAVALIAGFGTRILAIAYTILALGIAVTSHMHHGFFMNWYGNQAGEGFEYFLLWIAMSLSLFVLGGGRFSIDRKLIKA